MALPALTEDGELPFGVHHASLREILDRFGTGSVRRKALGLRLARIYGIARARFVVFGSFVTDGPQPRDVDVFLIMTDAFDASEFRGETHLLFDHAAAQAHCGASVFWVRQLAAWPSERRAIEFWQVKRGGGRRGIVENVPEAS